MFTSTSPSRLLRPMMTRVFRMMYSKSRPSRRANGAAAPGEFHSVVVVPRGDAGMDPGGDFRASRAQASASREWSDSTLVAIPGTDCSADARLLWCVSAWGSVA